jgi:uncharacterized protein involved in exopolysaccharide biosynthesis
MGLTAITMGGLVFYATKGEKKQYTSYTLINTGLVSGYNIESSMGARIDFTKTNNELENLISLAGAYETHEELGARLLAMYLMVKEPDSILIQDENFYELKEHLTSEVWEQVVDYDSYENTLNNIYKWRGRGDENIIFETLYSDHEFFGIEKLQTLEVAREGKSDMLRFTYTTIDPGVCQQTLILLTKIFIEKHKEMKKGMSNDVVAFFEEAVRKSAAKLRGVEDQLLAFRVNNKIINYYEQTRFIAAKKEDLDEFFFKEEMKIAAADSTIQNLENQLKIRVNLPEINDRLSKQREEISDLSARLAKFDVIALDSTTQMYEPQQKKWRDRLDELKEEMADEAANTFAIARTPEGVELKNLLTQWLSQIISLEEANARLDVITNRQREFEEIYSKFAPWGSQLKRIEREIDVAERAYLENLHSYNQALLHRFNLLMSTNLKIFDEPFFPVRPLSSKRILLVIVAFLAGFILTLGVIIAMEFLDNSLRDPVRAAETTGMTVISTLPKFPMRFKQSKGVRFPIIRQKAMDQLIQNVNLEIKDHSSGEETIKINIASTRELEGKSFVSLVVADELRKLGYNVLYQYPVEKNRMDRIRIKFEFDVDHPHNRPFLVNQNFQRHESFNDLIPEKEKGLFDYIILEIPGIIGRQFPIDLTRDANLTLVVGRANRSWNSADKKGLEILTRSVQDKPFMILNATQVDYLEYSLGEIPRRRSFIRRWVKKAALLEFFTRKTLM